MVAHTPKQVRVYSHTIWIGGLQPPKRNKNKQEHGKTTIKDKQQNWEARSRHGMFAGYKMKNGYEWTNMNEVWDLDAFRNANLKADVDFAQLKRVRPHIVRRIRAPPGNEIQFPLLKAYLEINDTLEGHRAATARDENFAAEANEVIRRDEEGGPNGTPTGDEIATNLDVATDILAGIVGKRLDEAKTNSTKSRTLTNKTIQPRRMFRVCLRLHRVLIGWVGLRIMMCFHRRNHQCLGA